MEQSARSGKQNIVEGSLVSATSKQSEIHLANVARASIGELHEDYKDFLRLRGLPIWAKDDPRMLAMRAMGTELATYETYRQHIESNDAEIVGNVMICLCAQAGFLLDQQIREQARLFSREDGGRECMTRACSGELSALEIPDCPCCGKPMCQRSARQGANAGKVCWGCSGFPGCRGTRKM